MQLSPLCNADAVVIITIMVVKNSICNDCFDRQTKNLMTSFQSNLGKRGREKEFLWILLCLYLLIISTQVPGTDNSVPLIP
mmetsp:Transcript_6296/g.11898  ORF Transcript_6296/g.11898 Transcript_6296/m.11898 type:complete len:81 (-) Transcript_6296:175-417(-)